MISKVRFLLVFGIVLAAVLIGEGKYAEDEGGLTNFGETSRIKKRSVWGLEPESDEEIECPRPRKEFWHPKFKKCVPYCGRNVKRDKFTGLCKENVETPQMFAWNNQHNQHGLYPRIGQVLFYYTLL